MRKEICTPKTVTKRGILFIGIDKVMLYIYILLRH